MITNEDRESLRSLLAKATAGEWKHHIQEYVKGRNDRVLSAPDQVILRDEDIDKHHWKRDDETDANWDFIAAAHNAMPALLEKIDALESERDTLFKLSGLSSDMRVSDYVDSLKRIGAAEWLERLSAIAPSVTMERGWFDREAAKLREEK